MAFARPTQPIRIGAYVLDPGLNALRGDGEELRLPPRLVDLLLRLAASPGQCVTREVLIDEVWERRQVNDEVLSRAIADLRQALGDDARAPRYIETLPKLGYRLLAPVEAAVPATPATVQVEAPAPARAATRTRHVWPILALIALLAALIAWWMHSSAPLSDPPDPLTADNLLRARPFTTEPGRELFPRFTPDGRWVIYARAAPDAPAVELRLRAVDGTEDRVLAEGGGDNFCGSVSPDGVQLAWLRARPGVCEVMLRPLLGGTARVVAGCGGGPFANCPDWAPDGRILVLGGARDGTSGLRAVAFPDGSESVLTTPPAGMQDLMPRHLRDEGDLVFWRGDVNGRTLYRLQRDTGREEALRAQSFLGFGHAVAAQGDLVVADDSLGQRALVRIAPRPGATPVLLGAADARHPDIARDGALVYEVARYDANLWRVALDHDEAAPQRLTASLRYDSQPAISPDAGWIAFGSNRDGREGVYLMRADGSEERKLPLDPALRWTSPVWSPDGESLLLMRYGAEGARLCTYRIATGNSECPPGFGRGRHAAFFLDAETVAAIDAESPAPTLSRLGREGVDTPIDAPGSVDRCRVSPRWLACHRPGRAGLWLQHRASGAVREVAPQLDSENRGAWALTDAAVYFTAAAEGLEPGIHRFDLETGTLHRVSAVWPNAIGDVISVAPDESFLVAVRTDALETDLMYVPPP